MADPSQVLPAKEQGVFRSLAKLQEQKQFKKVLKLADGILKSHPNHGETLSFKALALSSLKKKDEAYAAAKMALIKTKMRSYVAWHIFGLIYRSDRNYAEAIKCYRKALALSDNQQILKDLSILQIQIRDLKGYAETRKTMLAKTATQRSNWVGFSLAQHMCGNYNVALLILDTCLGFMRSHNDRDLYEQSEIFLYKVMLLEETGALEPAIAFLDAFESRIVDKIGWREKKAQLLLALGKFDEAKELFIALLDINPESFDYHRGLQACLLQSKSISSLSGCQLPVQDDKLDGAQLDAMATCYKEFAEKYPKAFAVKRIPLDFLTGAAFEQQADSFLRNGLRKGIPSLFSTLRPLYKKALGRRELTETYFTKGLTVSGSSQSGCQARVATVGKLVDGYLESLRKSSKLPGCDEEEAPTVFLWVLYFLAQHRDMLGDQNGALKLIDEAIEHSPTLVDLYHVKGRILKHAGALEAAADALEEGRTLDLADKWINSKSAKFQLRAGRIKKGEDVVALFTKHEGDSRGYLMDMQCMWFEIEAGMAYMRQDDLGMALKFFKSVAKHFDDFEQDQLDFHTYCLRKFTMRSYVGMLRLIERVRGDRFFATAAHGAVLCYLRIHDEKALFGPNQDDAQPDFSSMTAAERKRAKAKARKAEQKRKKEEEEKAAAAAAAAKQQEEKKEKPVKRWRDLPEDDDPTGAKLFETLREDPLKHASEIVRALVKYAPNNLQTHIDAFEVAVRRGKFLQALRALYAAVQLEKDHGGIEHPEIFSRLIPFLHFVQTGSITYAPWAGMSTSKEDKNKQVAKSLSVSPVAKEVIDAIAADIGIAGTPLDLCKAYYAKFAADHSSGDTAKRVAACKAQLLLVPSDAAPFKDVAGLPSCARIEAFDSVREFLLEHGAPADVTAAFEAKLQEAFPRAVQSQSSTQEE